MGHLEYNIGDSPLQFLKRRLRIDTNITIFGISIIPAKKQRLPLNPETSEVRKLRVAAYARVSTNNEEQLSSYEAQVDHYTRYIQSKDEWEFVEVYTDEGISATNTKKRDGFNRIV